ncbi:hypothetical protein [Streptomyces badius]
MPRSVTLGQEAPPCTFRTDSIKNAGRDAGAEVTDKVPSTSLLT